IVQNLLVAHFLHPEYSAINPNNSRVSMAIGNRQIQDESPEEELERLLEELALTHEQREFIESMLQEDGDSTNGE
ncbi:hypothetical protein UXP59_05950, partial [Enterobacter hormaechei]